jgi:hypothetical protein
LLQRSSHPPDRPALYAAQFALSHACWLICYPLAGWLQTSNGTFVTLLVLTALAVGGLLVARQVWASGAKRDLAHMHTNLPPDHPHLHNAVDGWHSHEFIVDDEHPRWPDRHGMLG